MSLSTSTSSHLNVITNVNIIQSQCHSQHQYHLISMTLSTSLPSYINIIINNNIILYQYYHKRQHPLISIIIINNNIISNHIPHIDTYKFHV